MTVPASSMAPPTADCWHGSTAGAVSGVQLVEAASSRTGGSVGLLAATGAERFVPLAVASALMMEFVDSTALSTALPALSLAFGTDPIYLKLALTSYLLALAVFAPASGWVADRFGARRIFLVAMAVFLTGSALCALSGSLPALVCARIVQGLGGAMMTPVGRLIVVSTTPKERLISAMAWYTTPALLGPLIGPPLAGLILSIASWKWIFLINFPVGLVGMFAVSRLVPPLVRPRPFGFDLFGFLLCGVGIIALAATAETVGLGVVPFWVQFGGALAAAGALTGYYAYTRTISHPVLDLSLLAYQSFRTSLVGGTVLRIGLGATPFLLPLLLQLGLGWSPARAGAVMVVMGVGAILARFASTALIRRFGFKTMLISTGIGAAVLTALPGQFGGGTPIAVIVVVLAASGAVRALQFTATNTIAYADVPQERVSAASTLATVAQQVGMSLGVTSGALALSLARVPDGPLSSDNFAFPFLAVGALTMLSAVVYVRLPASAGSAISGRRLAG